MKRGVPPTARKARTGELTPPGMTRWARSNRPLRWWSWQRRRPRSVLGFVGRTVGPGSGASPASSSPSSAGGRAQKKRSGTTLPMPGRKPRVQALVEEGQRLADGGLQLAAGGQQRGQRRRQRVAGADEGGVEALELLAGDRALRRGQHVVDELLRAAATPVTST